MKDLRLLQVIPSLNSGGVEQGTIDVANYISHYYGSENFIISSGGKMLSQINRKNLIHFTEPVHSKNPLTILKNIKKIRNIVRSNNINLIHVRSRAPAWSVYYACKNICKTSSTFHNIYGNENFLKKIYNKRMGMMNKIVAISDYVKEGIIDNYGISKKKIVVIHRGIDIDFYDPLISHENYFLEFISKYEFPAEKKIILFPGRLTRWKGQIEFLKVIESLDYKKFKCFFVGDDANQSYAQRLINLINKKKLGSVCKITGKLSQKDLRMFYKNSDIVVSAPTKPEGFGRIISEALSMKKIVLAYDYGGAKEQMLGLDKLYAVKPNNIDEFVKKINTVINLSYETKEDLGEIARKHVTERFSKKEMLDNYLKFYNSLI